MRGTKTYSEWEGAGLQGCPGSFERQVRCWWLAEKGIETVQGHVAGFGVLSANPGEDAGNEVLGRRKKVMDCRGLMDGYDGGPPAGAHAHIAHCDVSGRRYDEEKENGADPPQAQFHGVAAHHAG